VCCPRQADTRGPRAAPCGVDEVASNWCPRRDNG
jgi:hypothetical protein